MVEPATTELLYEANPHQIQVLESQKPLTFLGAGVGAGKTDAGTLWMLSRVMETPPGVLGLIGANTYGQLFDATLRNVFKNLDAWGWPHEPRVLPGGHSPLTLRISNGSGWVEVLARSMDSYQNLSGIEIGWFWLDEVWQTQREAFSLIQARTRDPRMETHRGLLTTTLDDPQSWMYEVFVDGYDKKRMRVIYATTHDNAHNLPDDYVDGLRSTYSARLFQRMVEAKWVSLEAGHIYYAFNRTRNVDESADYIEGLPILWSHDQNIGQGKPMSSCLCQIAKGEGPDGKVRPELHVFDEIVLESSDTRDAIKEFEGRGYGPDGTIIHGDASGRARDTRSKTSDYGILRDAGYTAQRVPTKNPPIRTRHNVVNRLLQSADGDVRLLVHPRCKNVIKGLETGKLKGGANYLEEETYSQHVTTALGYLCCVEFPERQRVVGGKPLIRLAARR